MRASDCGRHGAAEPGPELLAPLGYGSGHASAVAMAVVSFSATSAHLVGADGFDEPVHYVEPRQARPGRVEERSWVGLHRRTRIPPSRPRSCTTDRSVAP